MDSSTLTTQSNALKRFINLDLYPVHKLDSDIGRALLVDAHRMMEQDTLVVFPNFLTPAAVEILTTELVPLESTAHQINHLSTAYGWMNNSGFPEDHPRSAMFRRDCGVVSTELLPQSGPSQTLFGLDSLTEFVRRMLRAETLYRCACPTLAIQVNTMSEGECFGWHYDTNDGVVSFTIQNADTGGGFEYAPLIREEDDEHYDDVAQIFSNKKAPVRPHMTPGTLSLFLGRRSLHRVAPVGPTTQSRISLLFSYDRRPGMVFPAKTCERITSSSPEPYRGALT